MRVLASWWKRRTLTSSRAMCGAGELKAGCLVGRSRFGRLFLGAGCSSMARSISIGAAFSAWPACVLGEFGQGECEAACGLPAMHAIAVIAWVVCYTPARLADLFAGVLLPRRVWLMGVIHR